MTDFKQGSMFVIIWQYVIHTEHKQTFLQYYNPEGEWVKFFRESLDYLSTDLLALESDENTFLTIDRWTSEKAYNEFLKTNEVRYHQLDVRCEDLTLQENLLGKYFAIAE